MNNCRLGVSKCSYREAKQKQYDISRRLVIIPHTRPLGRQRKHGHLGVPSCASEHPASTRAATVHRPHDSPTHTRIARTYTHCRSRRSLRRSLARSPTPTTPRRVVVRGLAARLPACVLCA